LEVEGEKVWLRARASAGNQYFVEAEIDLGEKIKNIDGELVFDS
jgi:hypothetical protein